MNYAPYLGAIRGEHVRAAARSIVDRRCADDRETWAGSTFVSGGGKLRDGIRGPDFRFGAHETRAEQPPDGHLCPREIECSWGFARGFRAAPCRDVPAETERRRTWGGVEWLREPLVGPNWLYELAAVRRAQKAK